MSEMEWVALWVITGMALHLWKCLDAGVFSEDAGWTLLAILLFFNAAIVGPFYLLILYFHPIGRR